MMDLVIRNGNIVDGSGLPSYLGDIAINDGRIVRVGNVADTGTTEIDARGKIVSPGFIDPHTHFDAQLLWDGAAKPAIEHGVTTIVPGNCSLSLAPLKADHRMKLVGMFNQIEEMPFKAFEEGVVWDWETFEEFVTRIKKDLTINVAPLVGHSVLRLWVMGNESMHRTATAQETQAMQALLKECLDAGAIGLSTSFIDMDETLQPVPSRYADAAELDALCAVLGQHNRILQAVHEFYDNDITVARIDQLADISRKHKITTTLSPLFVNNDNFAGVDQAIARVVEQNEAGARVWPQVQTRPIDISFTFSVPSLLFIRLRTWYAVMRFGTPETIMAAFRDEAQRKQLVAEASNMMGLWQRLILRQVKTEANQQYVGKNLAEIAELRGTDALNVMIDLSLEEDLDAHFLSADMGHNNDEKVGSLLRHPHVMIGASDGGAHILSFSTYGDTGYLFSRFVRDNHSMSIEEAVKKITSDTADIWAIADRGLLKSGYIADVTIFDADLIDRGPEYYVQDVPGDGHRYVRDSVGVETVIIGGAVAYTQQGGYTDERRGEIVGGRP
ncbi:MAG: N-acyl-D-amino-acid deacylase family protein [Pseudomonadales bacterium]|jgi:N-acyl-D-amino-acid deacylase|tara:strand:+ start:6044 stop:7714 length:1671 start_codon:yes stop_codon:yes gene_type:complete